MPRLVRCGLIQVHCEWSPEKYSIRDISKKMLEKHEKLIHDAAKKKTQILCLQELFNGPYFCAEQQARWYEMTEPVPDGPTVERMRKLAKKYEMAMVVPVYEREMTGLFYNTAAVIDADGKYLGKYRKHHIPQVAPGFWEKFYFTPGNTGYLTFQTKFARIGVYICYDRHFPEGARVLGFEWRGDRVQSLGDGCWPERISMGARATGACGCERLLCRRHQSRGQGSAVEYRRILRQKLFLQSARQDHRAGQPGQGRSAGRGVGSGRNGQSPPDLAILPRPPAGELRRDHAHARACEVGKRSGLTRRGENRKMKLENKERSAARLGLRFSIFLFHFL